MSTDTVDTPLDEFDWGRNIAFLIDDLEFTVEEAVNYYRDEFPDQEAEILRGAAILDEVRAFHAGQAEERRQRWLARCGVVLRAEKKNPLVRLSPTPRPLPGRRARGSHHRQRRSTTRRTERGDDGPGDEGEPGSSGGDVR